MAEHRAVTRRSGVSRRGARRATQRGRTGRRAIVPVLLLSVGVFLSLGGLGTVAYWTDGSTVSSGSISSGSMDLQFDTNGAAGLGVAYARNDVTWTNLAPGERKAFNLTVKNVGNPSFTYTATVTRAATPAWTYVGTPVTVQFFAGTRAVVDTTYPQQEECTGAALGPARAVDGTNRSLLTPAPGIAGGGAQAVCMVVGIDATATNENQSRTGALSFSFVATQVEP